MYGIHEKEKKAIKILNAQLNTMTQDGYYKPMEEEATQTVLNLLEKQQKEIEQQHKTDNGLLRQELDMQIEHNKELDATLKQTQDSWFEDTQKLEQEKEKNKKLYEQNQIYVLDGSKVNLERHIKNNYIRKDKIQEKIKEYDGLKIIDKQAYEEQIKPLKELWEDNNG